VRFRVEGLGRVRLRGNVWAYDFWFKCLGLTVYGLGFRV
jgi:hypothetical protein